MKNPLVPIVSLAVTALLAAGCILTPPKPPAPVSSEGPTAPGAGEQPLSGGYRASGLTSVPQSVLRDTGARSLDLSGNQITSLPSEIGRLTNLETLDVSGNRLTGSLPGEIRMMQKLRVLDASDNQLTGIPAEVGQLKNLKTLDLSGNSIDGMPNETANLAGTLQVLDLTGNRYSAQQIAAIRAMLPNTDVRF